jgi:DNA-directed RNA polymerase alpha subunit
MTITELLREKRISMRSYHVCRANNINNVRDLKDFFVKNNSFLKLKNCGQKSHLELVKFIDNLKCDFETHELSNFVLFNSVLQNINELQKSKINLFIQKELSHLSTRSKNVILIYCQNKLNIDSFVNNFFENEKFRVDKMKNVGAKSIPEIIQYLRMIKLYMQDQITNHQINQVKLNL